MKAAQDRRELRTSRRGAAGWITLDRPAKINALTPEMVADLTAVLDEYDRDPAVRVVLLDGAGPRGFCAGGDIKFVRDSGLASDGLAPAFWADEYRLDAKIAGFVKPLVPFMTGIVMGGGVGLSAHTRHRVVTGSTQLAMPEVGIGLIPDIGATWLFARAPGEAGTYLALTGSTIGAPDAIALGFADHFVAEPSLEPVKAALVDADSAGDAGVDATLTRFATSPGRPLLETHRPLIDRTFAHDTVEEILAALERDGSEFALATARTIETKSPTSLKLTLRALREARELRNLHDALRLEYRLVYRLLGAHDFNEGIRAAVIDKDRRPRWRPGRLADVAQASLDPYFASLGPHELRL